MHTLSSKVVTSYKGFNSNLKCINYQYKVGKTYHHDGPVELCSSGFHACEYPLHIFNFYTPCSSRFTVVEQSGYMQTDNVKIVSSIIHIKREINILELATAAKKYIQDLHSLKCNIQGSDQDSEWVSINMGYDQTDVDGLDKLEHSEGASLTSVNTVKFGGTGGGVAVNSLNYGMAKNYATFGSAVSNRHYSIAENYGYCGTASNSGTCSLSINDSVSGVASVSGNNSISNNMGDFGIATNTGNYGMAVNTGDFGIATCTGSGGAITSVGKLAIAGTCGEFTLIESTGVRCAAISTGNNSATNSTGHGSIAGNTGLESTVDSKGDSTLSCCNGFLSTSSVKGKGSVAVASGNSGQAKASLGSAIVLTYRGESNELLHIRCGIAGRDIEPDTWYALDIDGEFVRMIHDDEE